MDVCFDINPNYRTESLYYKHNLMLILAFSPSDVIYLFHGICICTQCIGVPQESAPDTSPVQYKRCRKGVFLRNTYFTIPKIVKKKYSGCNAKECSQCTIKLHLIPTGSCGNQKYSGVQ